MVETSCKKKLRVLEHIYYFHFTQTTDKNSQFSSKFSNFNHVLVRFVKLYRCRFLYFFSLCDVRNEGIFLILEHSSLGEVKQKTNMTFKIKKYSQRLPKFS